MGEAKVWNVSSTPVNGTLALVIEGNGQQRDLETTNYQAEDSYWKSIPWLSWVPAWPYQQPYWSHPQPHSIGAILGDYGDN